MRDDIQHSICAAMAYLAGQQAQDGHWEEYSLPVGPSDAWVTAYVGLALSRATPRDGESSTARAAHRAADWLVANRPYAMGWGYNGRTGPDADSTAHAICLLHSLGMQEPERDYAWLLGRWQADGGFATFEGPHAWGESHVDITPICFRALSRHHGKELEGPVIRFLGRTRRPDGSWPSYWWRTGFYGSYASMALLHDFGLDPIPALRLAEMNETSSISSAFDLAFAIGIAAMEGESPLCEALTRELLQRQNADGGWPGGRELRVTEMDCSRPWEDPRGELYCDLKGLISTATCLSILSRL